jgi:SpoVK/Ycf46/Vps4 family AAA+-type ATPase
VLRDELRDGAVSAAKSFCHKEAERRHVLYAIARRYLGNAAVGPLVPAARAALEPAGNANASPSVSDDAAALLESLTSEEKAIAALSAAYGTGGGQEAGGTARQSQQAVAAVTEPKPAGPKPGETVDEILAELDALVGLGPVKSQVRSVLAVVQANAVREKAGKAAVSPSLHLVFTGPPGTGKTTVARLVARLYAAAGALPGAGFSEGSRADLVAGYVGQTAIKTMELINRTRPGVLFIDEAYALAGAGSSSVDFGAEAVATLVKAMEDHRRELAVIVAGYGEEMGEFIGSNPGLRSRFKTYIDFPDYSAGELVEIFARLAAESGIGLGAGVLERAGVVCAAAVGRPDFGNARFVRSLFEQAYARMAARAAMDGRVSLSELMMLEPEDLVLDEDGLRGERRRIGFGPGS